MSTRAEQKRATRGRVIDSALTLFAEKGLAATRTADIAGRAGLSHGGIFVHFRTRNELLSEVVSEIGRRITNRLHALVSENAGLEDVLKAHLDSLSQCESTYSAFLRESRLLPPGTLKTRIGVNSAISNYIGKSAEMEMRAGEIRRMPMHLIFNTWIGLVHHYLMNRELFSPHGSVLEDRKDELVSHFMFLLRAEKERT